MSSTALKEAQTKTAKTARIKGLSELDCPRFFTRGLARTLIQKKLEPVVRSVAVIAMVTPIAIKSYSIAVTASLINARTLDMLCHEWVLFTWAASGQSVSINVSRKIKFYVKIEQIKITLTSVFWH